MKRNQFYCLILIVLYSVSTNSLKAETTEPQEYHNMEQMLASLKLEKKQIELMVDKMAESGRITDEEAAKAKRELASFDDGDLNNLKNVAVSEIKTKRMLDH